MLAKEVGEITQLVLTLMYMVADSDLAHLGYGTVTTTGVGVVSTTGAGEATTILGDLIAGTTGVGAVTAAGEAMDMATAGVVLTIFGALPDITDMVAMEDMDMVIETTPTIVDEEDTTIIPLQAILVEQH